MLVPTPLTERSDMLKMFEHYGCYDLTDAWCAVYGFVVHLSMFVVEFLWQSTLWEDGSWGNSSLGGCLEYLGWGCT
jgi:hypothetical protein